MKKCRFCGKELQHKFVDLGMSPLANSFIKESGLNNKEEFYPLISYVCDECFLVQLEEFESPQNIFGDYAYFSSYSSSWLEHAKKYVNDITSRFKFDENSMVLEVASNDGYLLQYFRGKGIKVLGIEPANNVALEARKKDIDTICEFFGVNLANKLLNKGIKADLLVGNNVLAHVPDINDFVAGMKIVLNKSGIITVEVPHILRLIEKNQFDTIYHEHFSYFSLLTIKKIFNKHGLEVFDVEELKTHGGSLRVYIKHIENKDADKCISSRVGNLIDEERKNGLNSIESYKNFNITVRKVKEEILKFVIEAKENGKSIVGYGAPAKGNTLLNYCGIGNEFIDYVVDRNPHKQGLYLPGTHIPIYEVDRIMDTKPDYVIILPWNLKDEIIEQMNCIRSWGGKFVTLIPNIEVK